ncbi:MAG TPA: hypothetical protein VI278_09685 [Nitrososphaeraceae archaeon]
MRDNEKEMEGNNNQEQEEHSLSPILSTRYAYKAAKMIRAIGKNFVVIIGIVAAILFFAIIDILRETGYITLLPNDDITDTIITVLVAGSLAALAYAFWMLMKSRNMLNNWANAFEQNSIRSGMSIAMADKSKEEAVLAIAEVVEEIGDPLRKYIKSKENVNEFIDVFPDSIAKNGRQLSQNQKISFDVLIDEHRVQGIEAAANYSVANDLKEILKKYGSIIVKIIDGTIDKKSVQSFSKLISDYISMSKKNRVGLALLIGDDIARDARNYSRSSKKKKHNIILIEKPEHILSDNNNSSPIPDS